MRRHKRKPRTAHTHIGLLPVHLLSDAEQSRRAQQEQKHAQRERKQPEEPGAILLVFLTDNEAYIKLEWQQLRKDPANKSNVLMDMQHYRSSWDALHSSWIPDPAAYMAACLRTIDRGYITSIRIYYELLDEEVLQDNPVMKRAKEKEGDIRSYLEKLAHSRQIKFSSQTIPTSAMAHPPRPPNVGSPTVESPRSTRYNEFMAALAKAEEARIKEKALELIDTGSLMTRQQNSEQFQSVLDTQRERSQSPLPCKTFGSSFCRNDSPPSTQPRRLRRRRQNGPIVMARSTSQRQLLEQRRGAHKPSKSLGADPMATLSQMQRSEDARGNSSSRLSPSRSAQRSPRPRGADPAVLGSSRVKFSEDIRSSQAPTRSIVTSSRYLGSDSTSIPKRQSHEGMKAKPLRGLSMNRLALSQSK